MLERLFHLSARGSTPGTEVRAGLVTFLTMAYILVVNANILKDSGMPAQDVVLATALASAAACLVMGLWANFPFALAPGMGLNAFFTYGVVAGLGVSWQVALAAVFLEGLLFLILSLTGSRTAFLNAVPRSIKLATMGGIGLFLAILGFESAGLVRADPGTLVSLGDLGQPMALLTLAGVILVGVLMARRIKGAILIVILLTSLVAWLAHLAPAPEKVFTLPELPRETFLACFDVGLGELLSVSMLSVVLTFLFVDLLDTAGTLIGVGHLAGFLTDDGELPGADRAFAADALGTSVGALLGTSTVTSYVESATGVEEGGRTGLTAVVVAGLFVLALFFTPVFTAVPAAATAPALIVVGALMMRGVRELDWREPDEAIPAFLTLSVMPFTFSIANGLAAGIVSHVGVKLLAGKGRDVSPVMAGLALLLVAYFVFLK